MVDGRRQKVYRQNISESASVKRRMSGAALAENATRQARPRWTELGRRIQAAVVLSGRTLDDVASELNVSGKTLTRIMKGQREPRDREIQMLIRALDVPEWFLREGLAGAPNGRIGEKLNRLIHDVEIVKRRLPAVSHNTLE
jgi:transcriptional regulator with XRE-family HTH domain